MALISIKRNVDLQPGLNAPAVFNCSQSDKGTTIMLGLMNGGNDYTVPSGVTITIRGSRSNGAVFTPVSATSSGSTVSFTLTEEMTDTAGPTLCEAVLEQGNNVLGTANFIINVEGSPMGADVPPVFTDAAWTWMLGKLTTETVPALGDDVISSIQGKVDKSQGSTNAKKFLRVNTSGNVSLASTDKTLSVADQIADAKETGDQIRALDAEIDGVATTLGGSISTINGITTDLQSSKLNKNQGTSSAGKTMVVDSSGNIVPGDVPITIDDTLSIADAAADAKATGDALALKANESTIAPEFDTSTSYTTGSYVYKNGVLHRFTSDHSGAWTGTDAVVVTVGGEVADLKSDLKLPNSALFGDIDDTFPLAFENGTYTATSTGSTLTKYYGGGYDKTRKVVKSTVFNAPCDVSIKAKTGYSFTVFTSDDGIITGTSGLVTEYTMTSGNQYGMILRATGGTDDISAIDVSSIIDVKYIDNISVLDENIDDLRTDLSDVTSWSSESTLWNPVSRRNIFISVSDKWSSSGSPRPVSSIEPIPDDAVYIEVTSNATFFSQVAFLKTSSYAADTSPDYADGTGKIVIPVGETKNLKVPSDAEFFYVFHSRSGNTYTPDTLTLTVRKPILIADKTLTVEGAAADAEETGKQLDALRKCVLNEEIIDIESSTVIRGLISVNNLWSVSAGFYSYAFDVSEDYKEITVTAKEDNSSTIGLLKNSQLISYSTPPYCDGITSRVMVPAGNTITIAIPEDCRFIVVMKSGSDADYTPLSISFNKLRADSNVGIPLGLHEAPPSKSALNIVRRCRQMTDIKWTPAVDLPRYMLVQRGGAVIPDSANTQNYLGTFKAGIEYTGVPYGRVADTTDAYGIEYGTVGHYIDFETFISSVSNENSRLCKEDVGSVPEHRSVIYATVCSGLTCYALDVSEVSTASIANIPGLSFVGKLNDNGTLLADNKFAIGDVLNKNSYHTAIITDIIRDNEGIIQFVELSDASTAGLADRKYSDGQIGGVCRRKGWSREQLFDISSWGDYSLYRYTKNVPYTPSKYVNVGDEFNMQRIEHFPIMPYEGEGFAFKDGYIPNDAVRLVITLDEYSYARVFKDGEEITGSPFTVTKDSQNVINPIDVTEIGAGSYSAYLCNISDGDVTNMTYACHWTITA